MSEALAVIDNTPEAQLATLDTAPVAIIPQSSIVADPYVGVSAVPFDEHAQKVLADHQTVPDEWLDIKPNGNIYLSHMKARAILNQAFGFGGWAVVPVGDYRVEDNGKAVTLYRSYRLYVNGRFVGETVASGQYFKSNYDQDYSDAAEACQSYAINRLAKNFGLAAQCWDRQYGEQWKKKYAESYKNSKTDKTEWRKKPLAGAGAAPESPTQPRATVSQTAEAAPTPAVVRLKEVTSKSKANAATPWCIAVDDAGQEWGFKGRTLADFAEMCAGTPERVVLTYRAQDGKPHEVTFAEAYVEVAEVVNADQD
jgi:hypothetical protein